MPEKAARLELEDDEDLQLEFILAEKLGMTVERLRREMSAWEFVQWSRFLIMKADREAVATA